VIGTYHDQSGRNNQDAYVHRYRHHEQTEDTFMMGIVCDGCGSGEHSEVGARLGSQLLGVCLETQTHPRFFHRHPERIMGTVNSELLSMIENATWGMTADSNVAENLLLENFMFTIIGFVFTRAHKFVFHIGDGHIYVDGQHTALGPFPGNAPPYLAQGLFPEAHGGVVYDFKILELPTELNSLLIATDGLDDFLQHQGKGLPGNIESGSLGEQVSHSIGVVPPITELWENEKYFRNEAALQKFFNKVNPITRPSLRARGLLSDDTTLVVVRRE
jgi:serine/threonine protein phosphatase PrpC